MLVLFLLVLLAGGFFFEMIRKVVYPRKEVAIQQLWEELEKEEWFQALMANPHARDWILSDKENGLLKDPYYVRKIIDKEVHRDIFIHYIKDKTKQ
ncbi:hypothetical protein [Halalkalibacter krulwichiae]|uniref:Uncharacterized protein n=1 Tax=Halalkalibacter krulwichiae TaxID=199441 RepID=A0A1X9MLA7_9BACI|nr:hypothetical protein [Halalkalibacter krulwichiae]ARK31572.1 hypothetical protein BkAM31D_17935 [Halalkalibacter krulwichiae]